MEWGKIVDGLVVYAPPEVYDSEKRVKVLQTYDDYKNEGYKRVVRKKPSYNPYLQYLVLKEIKEDDDNIYITYEVIDITNNSNNERALTYEQLTSIIEEEVENNG